MKSGALDREITVEYKSQTLDPVYGSPVVVWIPLIVEPGSPVVAVKFRANVQDAVPSKSEALANGLNYSGNRTRIRMRYRSDIDSSMRIILHGDADQILQIVGGPAVLGRKEGLEMMCEAFSTE